MTIANKLMRELLDEVRRTPGFSFEEDGNVVRVSGPTGATTLTGANHTHMSGKDDRGWRQQLKRYAGWPPTTVGEALSLAQVKANGTNGTTPPEPKPVPIFDPVPKKLLGPSSIERPKLPAAPARILGRGKGKTSPGKAWTDDVMVYLRGLNGKRRSHEQIVTAISGKHYGLQNQSLIPILSNRFLSAADDEFLHVHRVRVLRNFEYWYDDTPRPAMERVEEKAPRPSYHTDEAATPEPEPEPEPEPMVSEPITSASKVAMSILTPPAAPKPAAKTPALPEVFERVGELLGDLLLRDENGDIWRARKGL